MMSNNRWQKSHIRNTVHEDTLRALNIETQETQPLPILLLHKPTLTELRTRCHLDICEVARNSGVRPHRIYLMEHGSLCNDEDVWRVLMVLSSCTGQIYRAEDVRGLHVKSRIKQFS